MEKRKRRWGDRYDGRRIRSLPPMDYVSPFIMRNRNDALNMFSGKIDMEILDEYIRKKRKEENLPQFGFMHVIMAAYVRVISQRPGLNRFIAGQRIYHRNEIMACMMVKKAMELDAQESDIKVSFEPTDTIYEVYKRVSDAVGVAKSEGDTTDMDVTARILVNLPRFILRFFIAVLRAMDYMGIMPKSLNKISPFHTGLFVSNLGSLGVPPVYHHIYNFGTVSFFLTFGAKRTEYVLNREGAAEKKKFIDYTLVMDERITDGHYMVSGIKYLEYLLKHPTLLDQPPEKVAEDVD